MILVSFDLIGEAITNHYRHSLIGLLPCIANQVPISPTFMRLDVGAAHH